MAFEIERKFLVNKNLWNKPNNGCHYTQAYLAKDGCTLRVRIAGDHAYLTIKSHTTGFTRLEFEYDIPMNDAVEMMKLAMSTPIDKIRYNVMYEGKLWEVDEFFGENEGLMVAEIELQSEDEPFAKPDWVTDEVTYDKRYTNSNLSKTPYTKW